MDAYKKAIALQPGCARIAVVGSSSLLVGQGGSRTCCVHRGRRGRFLFFFCSAVRVGARGQKALPLPMCSQCVALSPSLSLSRWLS